MCSIVFWFVVSFLPKPLSKSIENGVSVDVVNFAYSPVNATFGVMNASLTLHTPSNTSVWVYGYNISGLETDFLPICMMDGKNFTIIQTLTSSVPITPQTLDCFLLAMSSDQARRFAVPFTLDLYIPKTYNYTFSSNPSASSGLG
jgi:hypothetical protein